MTIGRLLRSRLFLPKLDRAVLGQIAKVQFEFFRSPLSSPISQHPPGSISALSNIISVTFMRAWFVLQCLTEATLPSVKRLAETSSPAHNPATSLPLPLCGICIVLPYIY
jgi:hypothetical protein